MSNYEQRSLLDRLVGACLMVLVAAAAIAIAVRLIEAVWSALLTTLVVAGVFVLAGLALRLWWRDRNGW